MAKPEVTLDEIETYMYCGEYFKAYRDGLIPLYEDRHPLNVVLTAGIRWLVNYYAKTNLLPTEDDVIVAVAKMIARAEARGFPVNSSQQINNINLTLLQLRSFLNNKPIESWNQIEMFNVFPEVDSGPINVMLNMPLVTEQNIVFLAKNLFDLP